MGWAWVGVGWAEVGWGGFGQAGVGWGWDGAGVDWVGGGLGLKWGGRVGVTTSLKASDRWPPPGASHRSLSIPPQCGPV